MSVSRDLIAALAFSALIMGAIRADEPESDLQALHPPISGTVDCRTDLRLRSGPGTSRMIMERLACGSHLSVLARDLDGGWYEVKTANGVTGWVSDQYVSLAELKTQDSAALLRPMNSAMDSGKILETPQVACGSLSEGSSKGNGSGNSSSCVSFDTSPYTTAGVANYESTLSAISKENASAGTKDSDAMKAFVDYISPLAVYLQTKTGYPASVILAQIDLETGHGTSTNFKQENNIAGLSCFDSHPLEQVSVDVCGVPQTIGMACTDRRPVREGGYYESFTTLLDGADAYLANLLTDDSTATAYSALRKAVNARPPGQPANWKIVVKGLKNYSASQSYVSALQKIIADYKLTRFDQMESCP